MTAADAGARPVVTTLLVVRHAEAHSNAGGYFAGQSDVALTERGRLQVNALGEALAHAKLDAVYCSDLVRALDTVRPIATAHGAPFESTRRLRERDMGALVGLSFERVRHEHPALWAQLVARDPSTRPPGGESHADVAARVGAFVDEIVARHHGQTVLLGSHGVAIHHLVRWALGVRDPHAASFFLSVENASVSRIDFVELGAGVVAPKLAYLNRVAPLPGEPLFP